MWRLFIPLMFFGLLTETTGWVLHNFKGWKTNALPFNVLLIYRGAFLIWFLGSYELKMRGWTQGFLIFFTGYSFVNLVFFQGIYRYNFYSETLADLIIAIFCCVYIYRLVTDSGYVDILRMESFWLTIGLLFYSMGSAILYTFYKMFAEYKAATGLNVGLYLNYGLNILLSLSLIIAFLCRRRTTRLSSAL